MIAVRKATCMQKYKREQEAEDLNRRFISTEITRFKTQEGEERMALHCKIEGINSC